MKLLLTNDDGIDAPGLAALQTAADGCGETVVAAPIETLSGCGHRATTEQAIRVDRRGPGRYAVAGTPADCVRLALHTLAPKLDWVVAGINDGGNLGVDVYHSGTVAAAREAVLHGVPGIAVSLYRTRAIDESDWARAAEWAKPILAELMSKPWGGGSYWNINLPSLDPGAARPEVVFCSPERSPLPLSFRDESGGLRYNGRYSERLRRAGSDVDICFSGKIAVSEISVLGSEG